MFRISLNRYVANLGRTAMLVLCVVLCLPSVSWAGARHSPSQAREVRIGVLALRGIDQARENWAATATYLSNRIPGTQFVIVPLPFDQIETYVADRKLDFVIVNPAMHVVLAEHYGVSPVATLINRLDDHDASLYGGVIFRLAGMPGYPSLDWIRNKRCLAVDPMSLGGFLAARGELYRHGLDPYKDCASLKFAGTHDAVVQAIIAGHADVGTVRTDVLERMAVEGKIDLSSIEVIAPFKGDVNGNFHYLRSTRLYPEWPISKLVGVSDQLARQVSMALLAMPAESTAAIKAEIVGWNVPMSYIPVVELLRDLGLPPFEPEPITVRRLVGRHPLTVMLIAGGIMVTGAFTLGLLVLNRRLHRARKSLVVTNLELEDRVKQRTEALQLSERELENLATHDALTGLLNRRALESRMIDEVNRVNRYGYALSVLMVDIDFFKRVNDTYGHVVGDLVLKEVSQLLVRTLRNTDVVARYGGEEFVLLLPMTHQKDAMMLAERLCQAVAEHDVTLTDGQQIRITISIGVVAVEQAGNTRWDMLLDAADQAMYVAKQSGRNRACAA